MSLFARVYLDEDVSVLVAVLLQAYGFDATTTRDGGMLGQTDEAQLAHAAGQGRCMVTHNRVHFERLHLRMLESGAGHAGMIVSAERRPHELARRIARLLNALTAEEIANQLLYV